MARNRGAAVAAPAGGDSVTTQRMRIPTNGPHDGDTLAPAITPAPGTVDFGAVRVPVPAGGTVSVEPTTAGRIQAVHVTVPEGRLSVSALAAPRNEGLWPELATEIDASLREGGARVRSFTGEWGRELHATTDGATSVFVGVDGPRWMLYGVATGPTRDAVSLDARLRRMLRGTVVVRGKAPYPVRTVLPLVTPSEAGVEELAATSAPPTMTLRAPAAAEGVLDAAGPTNGAMALGGPVVAATNGATNGAVNGAVNGAAAGGPESGAPASDAAGGRPSNGSAQNGATTGVFRRNGAPRRGASTTGATRKDVPPRGASTSGATRTGASPAGIPGAAGPATPPPRSGSTRRRQAATAPGVPFPGASTNGAAAGANRRGPATGAGRSSATTGANRTGAPTAGGGTTGVNPIGIPPGTQHTAAATTGMNRIGVPTRQNPAGGATTGVNQIGAPTGYSPAGGATTGANQIGVPTGYNPAGGATTGTNQIGAPTGVTHNGAPAAGAGRPAAAHGANGRDGSSPTGATWSGAYSSGSPAAETGTSPYGVPANDLPTHHAAGGGPAPGATWDGGRSAAPPWSSTPGPTGAFPTGGPTAGSSPILQANAAPRPETNGAPLGPAGLPTAASGGGFSRPDVPAAWAHQTGTDHSPSVDAGLATPPPAPIAHHEPALPPGPPRPEPPRFTDVPAADRPSWADAPSDRAAAGHWDPLVDPLPIDLEPLPAPDPVWADDRSSASNGRLDDSSATSRRRGGRQDAGEPTNGAEARRWRAADLLRDRDSDNAVGTARRWRAVHLLVGREDTHGATDGATPKWRAADLLSGNAVPGSQETGRSYADVDAAARGRGNGRDATDEAGYDVPATRWLAADLLDGSEPAVGGRRGRATEPSERQPVNGHAEPHRRAAPAPDDEHGATRWRAADLLDGRRSGADPSTAAALRHDQNPADSSTASPWRAAELLDGGGSRDANRAEPRRRVADRLGDHGHSGDATTTTQAGWRIADRLDGRGSSDAATHAEPRPRVADRLGSRDAEPRWRAASLLEGRGDAETAAAWETSPAHDRRSDATGDDLPARRWRAADLLNAETGESARPRRRAGTPETRPATEGASTPPPDAEAGRRRRSASTGDQRTGRRHAPTPEQDAQPEAPSRHGGENRHAGPPSRVPPTQWAWPKEPAPPSSEPLPARRAADTGNRTAWSASDLLDEGKHAGGRRRAPESARHGAAIDDEAGRHYRP